MNVVDSSEGRWREGFKLIKHEIIKIREICLINLPKFNIYNWMLISDLGFSRWSSLLCAFFGKTRNKGHLNQF